MAAVAADVLSDKFFEPPDCHILLRVNSQAMFYQQCRRYALSLDLFPSKWPLWIWRTPQDGLPSFRIATLAW